MTGKYDAIECLGTLLIHSDISQLLRALETVECEEYLELFVDNDIDLSLLAIMDRPALKELGVTKVGDRLRLQILIEMLNMEKVKSQVSTHELAGAMQKWLDVNEDETDRDNEMYSGTKNMITAITQDGNTHKVDITGCTTASAIKKRILERVDVDGAMIAEEWSTYYIDRTRSVHLMFNVELATVCNSTSREEKNRILFCRTGEAPSNDAIGRSNQIVAEGSGGSSIKRVMGQRPPSQLISTNLYEYFPDVKSSELKQAVRNSYRLSVYGSKMMRNMDVADNRSSVQYSVRNSIYSNYSRLSGASGVASVGTALPFRLNQTVGDVLLSNTNAREGAEQDIVERTAEPAGVVAAPDTVVTAPDTVVAAPDTVIGADTATHTVSGTVKDNTDVATLSQISLLDDEDDGDFLLDAYNDMSLEEEASSTSLPGSGQDGSLVSILTSEKNQGPSVWHKGSKIGQGSYGTVYLGLDGLTGELMAVKEVDLPREGSRDKVANALKQEMNLLRDLDHENIVRYLGSASDATKMFIFLEYVPGGSVSAMLQTYGPFEEPLIRNFLTQILVGVRYLHSKGIIHRDIKGANILVDINGTAKIGDFGISKRISGAEDEPQADKDHNRVSFQGSVYWMAPEVVKQIATTEKSDIWSVGCVAVEMMTAEHPYPGFSQMQTIFRIGTLTLPDYPTNCSKEARDFLDQTFETDYTKRKGAASMLTHPFLRMIFK